MTRRALVLASDNAGKLRELAALLAPLGFDPSPQRALGIEAAEEPHATFVENALAKARHASRASGLPALADDSGICVPVLRGAPGVRSARFAGVEGDGADAANNRQLIAALRRVGAGQTWRADYYCVLVYLRHADDPRPMIAEGVWHGIVIPEARGTRGFGYDPHFLLPGHDRTAAELAPSMKNRLSHRGRALRALARSLAAGDAAGP